MAREWSNMAIVYLGLWVKIITNSDVVNYTYWAIRKNQVLIFGRSKIIVSVVCRGQGGNLKFLSAGSTIMSREEKGRKQPAAFLTNLRMLGKGFSRIHHLIDRSVAQESKNY